MSKNSSSEIFLGCGTKNDSSTTSFSLDVSLFSTYPPKTLI